MRIGRIVLLLLVCWMSIQQALLPVPAAAPSFTSDPDRFSFPIPDEFPDPLDNEDAVKVLAADCAHDTLAPFALPSDGDLVPTLHPDDDHPAQRLSSQTLLYAFHHLLL